jgi:hypothetical protein
MTGFTTIQVIEYLGPPDAIGRGDYAGFTYYYGESAGSPQPTEVEIIFAEDFGDRAVQLTVNPPYPGKTGFGVGLESDKKTTRWFLGPPDAQEVHGDWMRLGEWSLRGDVYFSGDSKGFAKTNFDFWHTVHQGYSAWIHQAIVAPPNNALKLTSNRARISKGQWMFSGSSSMNRQPTRAQGARKRLAQLSFVR